jgi:hypothetical protein
VFAIRMLCRVQQCKELTGCTCTCSHLIRVNNSGCCALPEERLPLAPGCQRLAGRALQLLGVTGS